MQLGAPERMKRRCVCCVARLSCPCRHEMPGGSLRLGHWSLPETLYRLGFAEATSTICGARLRSSVRAVQATSTCFGAQLRSMGL